MSSILTNMAAMSALQSLAATQKNLSTTQNQISSGLRVSDASDNAAYWSIATTMRGDTSALSSVSDALNLGTSVVGTATAAVNSTLSIMYKLKADLVTAQTPGTDKTQVQSDISAQQQSLLGILSSASFNGVNLLDGTANSGTGSASFVSSFTRASDGSTSVGTISVNTAATGTGATQLTGTAGSGSVGVAGIGILAASLGMATAAGTAGTGTNVAAGASDYYAQDSVLGFSVVGASSADLTTLSNGIDSALKSITAVGASLGAVQTDITNQSTFVTALSDAITSGVGSLVDADMNEASTRLNALQTQQQLGVQSLSIANQNSQLILKLFQ